MLKRYLRYLLPLVLLTSCSTTDVQRTLDTLLGSGELSSSEISAGLKQALEIGITKGSDRLSEPGGYFDSVYRIPLPPEAEKVAEKLRIIPGFSDFEETIVRRINRGAEDAAKKAAPIFINAIKEMTIQDARDILLGPQDAATRYLHRATYDPLYEAFNPVIIESLDEFKARELWSEAMEAYNKIPLVEPANPDLDDFVTTKALEGLFGMVEKEEINIRENVSARTTELLRRVFAAQDNR
jgi:hypothetical protein